MSFDWIGSIFQSGAQNRATQQNAANVAATNQANLILNIMSRGGALTAQEAQQLGVPQLAGQSSAILPYYMSQIEQAAGTTSGAISQQILSSGGSPAQQMQQAMAVTAGLQPSLNQATTLGQQLVSGDVTKQMLAEQAPVSAATLAVPEVEKNAALQQLDATLNDIDAIQARKGYSGDSYGNRLLKFQARAGIMSQAAGGIAQAKLANARSVQGIQQQGRQLQLSNLGLPGELAANELNFQNLPSQTLATKAQLGQQPLGFFNIGNRAFQEQNKPLVDYTSATGLGLSGLGSNLSSALNYGLQQQRLNQIYGNNTPQLTESDLTPTTYGAFSGAGAGQSYDPGAASPPISLE